MVYILLGDGFEEMEAIAPTDLLRRAGVDTKLVGIDGKVVTGAHGIQVEADITLSEVDLDELELLMLPGGSDGVQSIRANQGAMGLIRIAYAKGRYLAAICAAPLLLAEQGILDCHNATCYPGLESEMGNGATMINTNTVVDGRVITGRAPGTAVEFGLTLVRILCGDEISKMVQEEIHYETK